MPHSSVKKIAIEADNELLEEDDYKDIGKKYKHLNEKLDITLEKIKERKSKAKK